MKIAENPVEMCVFSWFDYSIPWYLGIHWCSIHTVAGGMSPTAVGCSRIDMLCKHTLRSGVVSAVKTSKSNQYVSGADSR
jgi:hypothetical protein